MLRGTSNVFLQKLLCSPWRAPCTALGLRARAPLLSLAVVYGLACLPCRQSGAQGKKLVGGEGVSLAADDIVVDLYHPVPA
jgi:hypothetical protein